MPDPSLRELLTPQGMADGHGAVITAYECFTHASEVRHFETMKKKGLQLAWPNGAFDVAEITCSVLRTSDPIGRTDLAGRKTGSRFLRAGVRR
jgi:hypothetical protein